MAIFCLEESEDSACFIAMFSSMFLFMAAPLVKSVSQKSAKHTTWFFTPCGSLSALRGKGAEFYFCIPSNHMEFHLQEGLVIWAVVSLVLNDSLYKPCRKKMKA